MNLNNLVTIISALAINALIFIFLLKQEIKNPKKFNGLRLWLISTIIRLASITLTLIYYDTNIKLHQTISYITYTTNIISFFLLSISMLQFVHKRISKLHIIFGLAPVFLLIIFAIINNTTMFVLFTTLSIIYYSIVQLVIVNNKTSLEVKSNWSTYTTLQLFLTLIVTLYLILRTILFKDNLINLIHYEETNTLVKSISLLSVINALLILVSLEITYFLNESKIKQFFNILLDLSDTVNLIVNTNNSKIIDIDNEFLNKLGYKDKTELINKDLKEIVENINDCEVLKEHMKDGAYHVSNLNLITKDNKRMYFDVLFRNVVFKNNTYCLLHFDELNTINEHYKQLAYEDELTKLPNRRRIKDLFNQYKTMKKEFYLLIIDIDNFKKLNDTKGHLYGDLVLKKIGDELNKYNKTDQLAARYGGDEFLLFVPKNENRNINNKIKKIYNLFNNKILINENHVKINISIGYSFYPIEGKTLDSLIKVADDNLYYDKKNKINKSKFK